LGVWNNSDEVKNVIPPYSDLNPNKKRSVVSTSGPANIILPLISTSNGLASAEESLFMRSERSYCWMPFTFPLKDVKRKSQWQ